MQTASCRVANGLQATSISVRQVDFAQHRLRLHYRSHISKTKQAAYRDRKLVLTCAAKEDSLRAQIEASLKALQEATVKLGAEESLKASVDSSPSVEDREERLWNRQEKLWEREMQRWDEERKMWNEKEAKMQQQIEDLKNIIIDLASQQASLAKTLSQSQLSMQASSYSDVASSTVSESFTVPAPPTPRQLEEKQPPRTASLNSEESVNQGSNPGWSALFDGVLKPSFVDELAAAVAAVDEVDVLNEEPNFQLSQQQKQTASTVSASSHAPSTSTTGMNGSAKSQGGESVGSPPLLVSGDDDIFWMNKLQSALMDQGYFCGDEEMEDWYFGEQTQSALLTFQACSGLPETGVADEDTWAALLGDSLEGVMEAFNARMASNGVKPGSAAAKAKQKLDKWPALQEGDGGRFVHALHVAMEKKGCYPGEDDIQWWWFGDTTLAAVRAFQACAGLPESGVCEEKTWKALLGQDAQPADLFEMWSGNEFDEDLTAERKGIFLIGEQRWEDPTRLRKLREMNAANGK